MVESKERPAGAGQEDFMERRQAAALELLRSILQELEGRGQSELAEDVEGVIEILTGQLDSEI